MVTLDELVIITGPTFKFKPWEPFRLPMAFPAVCMVRFPVVVIASPKSSLSLMVLLVWMERFLAPAVTPSITTADEKFALPIVSVPVVVI